MIGLTRDRTAISPTFLDPIRQVNLLELYRAGRDGMLNDPTVKGQVLKSDRWKAAKPQLASETHGKCAFCEAATSASYYGDVEHFRPKAVYWWLAYCYDNFLYSCRVCNGKKSDTHRFTGTALVAPALAPAVDDAALWNLVQTHVPDPADHSLAAALVQRFAVEIAHLPNPYELDPEPLFAWEVDKVLREVRLVPANARPEVQRAAAAADAVLDLNRDELLDWRWRTYHHLEQLRDLIYVASDPVRSRLVDLMRGMTEPEIPFAGMSRYFARRVWGLV